MLPCVEVSQENLEVTEEQAALSRSLAPLFPMRFCPLLLVAPRVSSAESLPYPYPGEEGECFSEGAEVLFEKSWPSPSCITKGQR